MKLSKFLKIIRCGPWDDPEIEFVGMKWQDEHHPSAQLWPIEFVDAVSKGDDKVTIKFITTKHNP